MEGPMTPLERLGRRAREAQERILDPAAAQRRTLERLLGEGPALARRSPSRARGRIGTRQVYTLAAAALIALFAAGALVGHRPSGLTFAVGSDADRGRVGAWLAAGDSDLPISFSDGSRLALGAHGRVRVASVDAEGARVVLERGALDASVVHREGTHWSVDAGPYVVRVTGTRFSVSWDPDREALSLSLAEGSVIVTGPMFPDGRRVSTGESVSASARGPKATSHEAFDSPSSEPVPPEPAPSGEASAKAQDGAAHDLHPSWRALAEKGAYREALKEAERIGFDALAARAGADELVLLADAARLGGGGPRAVQALAALRQRFPGDPRASAAAFQLGRMAFDGRGAYSEAARWFMTYLAEQPGGPFAREAAGRLIEARERSGDVAGAREAAKAYLARHPSGPHAAKAQSLLATEPPETHGDAGEQAPSTP